jgi:hypothetical protein
MHRSKRNAMLYSITIGDREHIVGDFDAKRILADHKCC